MRRHVPVLLATVIVTILALLAGCAGPPEGSAEWYFANAYKLAQQKQYVEAIGAYTDAIRVEPSMAKLYANRAASYAAIEAYDEAIADCTKAISLDPGLELAYINRAYAYNVKGSYDLAIQDNNRAIDLLRTETRTLINNERTIRDTNKALAVTYTSRALAYLNLGDYQRAVADCNEAIELRPDYPDAYFNRAFAFKALDKKEEAIADFDKYMRLSNNPNLIDTARREIEALAEKK